MPNNKKTDSKDIHNEFNTKTQKPFKFLKKSCKEENKAVSQIVNIYDSFNYSMSLNNK